MSIPARPTLPPLAQRDRWREHLASPRGVCLPHAPPLHPGAPTPVSSAPASAHGSQASRSVLQIEETEAQESGDVYMHT